MSGGSWGYFYLALEAVVNRLKTSTDPDRIVLGKYLEPAVNALHAVEWVDSRDMDKGKDRDAILKALGPLYECFLIQGIREQIDRKTLNPEQGLDMFLGTLKAIDDETRQTQEPAKK